MFPVFYVTGSLYRPKDKSGKLPAVLSPHGHWTNGRFLDSGLAEAQKEIAEGAERFESGARSPLQARCVQLARMGCVVFHYDMIGYADCVQIPATIAHQFAKQRPEMNTRENWGLFSPQAEMHLQSVMGLQTWNSIRALDFLCDLPDVDPNRVAVTGASGGGTQTFILCALDPRPAAAFPAVMVSTAMQGGCSCENASLLRVDGGNVEFAALFAPKPLGMTAANDWTREMPAKGFPELQQLYKMLGAPDRVTLKPLLHFGHNYNHVSRTAMYQWINHQFKLNLPEPVLEQDFTLSTPQELTVWDKEHPKPQGGVEFERALLRRLHENSQAQLAQYESNRDEYDKIQGQAFRLLIGRTLDKAGEVTTVFTQTIHRESYSEQVGLLKNSTYQEELPIIILEPNQKTNQIVVWVDAMGKAALFRPKTNGTYHLLPEIKKLLDAGVVVVGVDLFQQGEFTTNGLPLASNPKVKNPREVPAYTYGYNHSLFAHRVHDLLSVIQYIKVQNGDNAVLDMVGLNGAAHWVAAARVCSGQALHAIAIDTAGFRFSSILDYRDPQFLPGGAKYGDLPGILALGCPGLLWLSGEGETIPALIQKRCQILGTDNKCSLYNGSEWWKTEASTVWLTLSRGAK